MPKAFDHSKSRTLVCLICRNKIFKTATRIHSGSKLLAKIRTYYKLFENYDPGDMTFPNSLCNNCVRGLYRCDGGQTDPPYVRACAYVNGLLHAHDPIHTRKCAGAAACNICSTARQKYKTQALDPCSCSTCIEINKRPPKTNKVQPQPTTAPEKYSFTAKDLIDIQAQQHASDIQIIRLSSSIRKICGKNSVEPNLRDLLRENALKLTDFFTTTMAKMHVCDSSVLQDRIIVHCVDLEAFIMHVIKEREYDPYNHLVRIGLDGGQNMFKLVLNIINTSDNVEPGQYKDSGVRKTFIIAIAESIKENYENVNTIMDKITNFDRIKYYICSDLKLINIICGIQSSSSKHPCPYCIADNSNLFLENFPKRSVNSITISASAFQRAGSAIKECMLYDNCLKEPILPGYKEEYILDICAPPQLHIVLGVVKLVYDNMYKEWPGAALWIAELNIKQKNYHSGAFVGNDCMKMLKNIDKLQQMAPIQIQRFVHLLRIFYKIVESCFGMDLDPDYKVYIKNFKQVYSDLHIKVTPKVHILTEHIPDFCEKNNRSLGWFSEQALESTHHDFHVNTWKKQSYKRNLGHSNYASKLKDAVVSYNSKNI